MIDVYRKFAESKVVQGSQIWAWSDDMFCVPNMGRENGRGWIPEHFSEEMYNMPGRGLCGDAPWGVVDSWRRRKPEFWIIKKLHSPVKLKDAPLPVPEAGEPIRVPVQNLYDFTDLSELKIDWQLGNSEGHAERLRRAAIRRRTDHRRRHAESGRRFGDRFPRREGTTGR